MSRHMRLDWTMPTCVLVRAEVAAVEPFAIGFGLSEERKC
jgi:hypothetical protein